MARTGGPRSRFHRTRPLLGALLAAAALLACAPAASAGDWLTTHSQLTPTAPSGSTRAPAGIAQIGMDANSNATAFIPATDGSGNTYVQTSDRPAGGDWSAPQELTGAIHSWFSSAVDGAGDAVLAWVQPTSLHLCIPSCITINYWSLRSVYRPSGGTWGSVQTISTLNQSSGDLTSPQVAFDGSGNVLVVWSAYSSSNSNWSVNYADRTAGSSGAWTSASTLASGISLSDPQPSVAVDSAGDAVAAWTTYQSGPLYAAQASLRAAGGSWDGAHGIGSATSASTSEAHAAIVALGTPYPAVAWIQGGYVKTGYRDSTTGNWTQYAPTTTSLPTAGGASNLQLAMTTSGTSVLAWREGGGSPTNYDTYVAAATGYVFNMSASVLSPYANAYGGGNDFAASAPALSIDAGNTPTVLWTLFDYNSYNAGNYSIDLQSMRMSSYPTWDSSPETVESASTSSSDWVTPAGAAAGYDAEALWGKGGSYDSSVFDGTPPNQTSVNVPDTAAAGSAVSMSLSASDTWNSTSTRWSFGDGSSDTGESTSHTYAYPGTFTVRAVTTDYSGNRTVSAAHEITVSPSDSSTGSSWLAPTSFVSSSPGGATVAVNGAGDAAATWYESPDTCTGADADFHPAGGSWSTQALGSGCNPHVAISDAGDAIAVWEDPGCNGGAQTDCVYASERPAGGSWGTPAQVASGTQISQNAPVVAFAPNGSATAAWWTYDGVSTYTLQTADWSSGSWSSPVAVPGSADGGQGSQPKLVFDHQNDAGLVWQSSGGGGTFGVKGTTRPAGGSWANAATDTALGGAIVPLGATAPSLPDLAADSQGNFLAIWDVGGTISTASATAAGATWTVKTGPGGTNPVVAFDAAGVAIGAWTGSNGSASWTETATLAAGGGWSAAQQLSPTTKSHGAASQAIVTDGQGNAYVGWIETITDPAVGSNLNLVQVARRSAGSASSAAAETLASSPNPIGGPFMGADGPGDVTVMWTVGNVVQTTTYDPVAPSIGTVDIPDTATVGTATTYTASANDAWGPLSYSWSFDGGAPMSGKSVSYTFPHASPHSVTLTVRDGAGNTATLTRAIAVSNPPATTTQTPTTPGATPLPPPVLGETINVYVIKDPVFIKLPGEKKFHRLIGQAHLPNGTVIDTRHGRVLVVIDNGNGSTDSAQFYEGVFEVNQPKKLHGLANIFLNGGGFKGCPKAAVNPHALISSKNASPTRSVRHLWGSGHGKFRTVGRFAAATVRGTTWETDDRCNGTLVKVTAGKVSVRDFVRNQTVLVKAKHQYFAKAR